MLDAVGASSTLELGESREFRFVNRDDELATGFNGDAPHFASLPERGGAFTTEPCSKRSGRVVEPGVHHAGVMSALVPRRRVLLLEDDHSKVGESLENPVDAGEADQSGTDNREVEMVAAVPLPHSRQTTPGRNPGIGASQLFADARVLRRGGVSKGDQIFGILVLELMTNSRSSAMKGDLDSVRA
jgi:hypothetical protein